MSSSWAVMPRSCSSCSSARGNIGYLLSSRGLDVVGVVGRGHVAAERGLELGTGPSAVMGRLANELVGVDRVEPGQASRSWWVEPQHVVGSQQVGDLGVRAGALAAEKHIDHGATSGPLH